MESSPLDAATLNAAIDKEIEVFFIILKYF